MMEVDKKKTRTDEAWVRLYARFETDCLLPADAEHAPATHRRLLLRALKRQNLLFLLPWALIQNRR